MSQKADLETYDWQRRSVGRVVTNGSISNNSCHYLRLLPGLETVPAKSMHFQELTEIRELKQEIRELKELIKNG